MSDAVLDASAVLAVLGAEDGHEAVLPYLAGARLSAVNAAEVLSKLADVGIAAETARGHLTRLGLSVEPFGEPQAVMVARLRERTRSRGLSLGDRACLALAAERGSIAVTADRSWAELDVGVDVVVVR